MNLLPYRTPGSGKYYPCSGLPADHDIIDVDPACFLGTDEKKFCF
jgi:hypothetical protein